MKRSDLPFPELKLNDRVIVTADIIKLGKAEGTIKKFSSDKPPTNDYVSVGVEFDKSPGKIFYFYPFECEVIKE